MQENNLKGLWIPYEILTNEKLSDKEKYIYSLILFYSKNDGYCTITNIFYSHYYHIFFHFQIALLGKTQDLPRAFNILYF